MYAGCLDRMQLPLLQPMLTRFEESALSDDGRSLPVLCSVLVDRFCPWTDVSDTKQMRPARPIGCPSGPCPSCHVGCKTKEMPDREDEPDPVGTRKRFTGRRGFFFLLQYSQNSILRRSHCVQFQIAISTLYQRTMVV